MSKVEVFNGRILAKRITENEGEGELYIPDSAQKNDSVATIVAIDLTEDGDNVFKIGDKIYYDEAIRVNVQGEELLVINYKDILLRVEE